MLDGGRITRASGEPAAAGLVACDAEPEWVRWTYLKGDWVVGAMEEIPGLAEAGRVVLPVAGPVPVPVGDSRELMSMVFNLNHLALTSLLLLLYSLLLLLRCCQSRPIILTVLVRLWSLFRVWIGGRSSAVVVVVRYFHSTTCVKPQAVLLHLRSPRVGQTRQRRR
jgi:hypothetical protein